MASIEEDLKPSIESAIGDNCFFKCNRSGPLSDANQNTSSRPELESNHWRVSKNAFSEPDCTETKVTSPER